MLVYRIIWYEGKWDVGRHYNYREASDFWDTFLPDTYLDEDVAERDAKRYNEIQLTLGDFKTYQKVKRILSSDDSE